MDNRIFNNSNITSFNQKYSNEYTTNFEDPLECSGYLKDETLKEYSEFISVQSFDRQNILNKRKQNADIFMYEKFSSSSINRTEISNKIGMDLTSDIPKDSILSLFTSHSQNKTNNSCLESSNIKNIKYQNDKINKNINVLQNLSEISSSNLDKSTLNGNLKNKKNNILDLKLTNISQNICSNKKRMKNTQNIRNLASNLNKNKNYKKSIDELPTIPKVKRTFKKYSKHTRNQRRNSNAKISKLYDSFKTVCLTPIKSNISLTDSSVPDEENSTLQNKSSKFQTEQVFTPLNQKKSDFNDRALNIKVRNAIQIINDDLNTLHNTKDLIKAVNHKRNNNNESVTTYSNILKGLTIFVDVWSGSDNVSKCVEYELRQMGSKIAPCMKHDVTHLVFKEGSIINYEKALEYNIFIVSVNWVDMCKNLKTRVCEKQFPATSIYGVKRKTYQYQEVITKKVIRVTEEVNSSDTSNELLINKHNLDLQQSAGNENYLSLMPQKKNENDKRNKTIKFHKMKKKQSMNYSKMNFKQNDQVLNDSFQKQKKFERNNLECANKKEYFNSIVKINKPSKETELFSLKHQESLNNEKKINICLSNKGESDFLSLLDPHKSLPVSQLMIQDSNTSSNNANQDKSFENISSNNLNLTSLLMTGLSFEEQQIVIRVVGKLKGFQIVKSVQNNTTHLISCGKRTINVLFAIAQDCWILSIDWILLSEKKGFWLPEQQFVLTNNFPAAKVIQDSSPPVKSILRQFGKFYIGKNCSVPKFTLEKLIHLYGGKVTNSIEDCKVFIGSKGDSYTKRKIKIVSDKWIFDCISNGKILPYED